jgi:hypothetical protein
VKAKASVQVFLFILTQNFLSHPLTRILCEHSGDHDLQVPLLGTQAWIRSFNFPIVDDWRAWHLDGQAAGLSHLSGNFEYLPHGLCAISCMYPSFEWVISFAQIYDSIRKQLDICNHKGDIV